MAAKKPPPRTNARNKTGKLTKHDQKRAVKVPCPSLGRPGHGSSCSVCHGKNEIDATP